MLPAYPKWGAEPFHGQKWNVLVYGFKIGSDKLEAEHKLGIEAYAARILEKTSTYSFVVIVKGNCSRSGSAGINLALSIQRANAVATYLKSLMPSNVTVVPVGFGEAAADLDGMLDGSESERHRSVLMVAVDYKRGTPPPPPAEIKKKVPKIWTPPTPTGEYSVQMRGGVEGSAGIPLPFGFSVGGNVARFRLRIRDVSRFIYADYFLYTASLKGDWGSPGSIEAFTEGPAQTFYVYPNFRVEDFEGFVDITAGSIDFSKSVAGFGFVQSTRYLETTSEHSAFHFSIPPGTQAWEFGKFGAGVSSGKGYLDIIR